MAMSNTVTELRDELFNIFRGLKTGVVQPKVAKEMNNSAGKIIGTAKAQLEYYSMRKEKPNIKFFNVK